MSGTKNIIGFTALLAFLIAGSCAAPTNDGNGIIDRGADNHPITVTPEYNSIRLPFSASAAGLMPEDSARFQNFVEAYKSGGNGSISVSAPQGPEASAAISYFGERLAQMGVPRNRIIVATRPAYDRTVEIGFIGYQASVAPCGDWSSNLGNTASNRASPNFGCASQQNLAAMVSDPRDLIQPRDMDPDVSTLRRSTVLDKYGKGEVTANTKNAANNAAVSEVNKQ